MEKESGGARFFYAEAAEGINALLTECRLRFRHLFSDAERAEEDRIGVSPYRIIGEKIDEFEKWKDIVAEGNLSNLDNMTFLEFMAKLDRTIEKAEREAKEAKERLEQIKAKGHGR